MWHETKEEMKLLLESGLRMDVHSTDKSHDYDYDWELHIFFDDAFQKGTKEDGQEWKKVNNYVLKLFEAMREVHVEKNKFRKRTGQQRINFELPSMLSPEAKVQETAYGGRVTWELENGTNVVCHLKDKEMIRHKKRWSQCMYFNYFYRLSDLYNEFDEKRPERGNHVTTQMAKTIHKMSMKNRGPEVLKSQNTFVLALDGDVDFDHLAVTRLLDVMIKNKNIGAACGRIHPTGSGMIAGYQKFEYAVGHWFQKSTEDALGNVLCSPGCFSLFRLKAVCENHITDRLPKWDRKMIKKRDKQGKYMESKMPKYIDQLERKEDFNKTSMEKYFTKTESGWQSIQYDQGEDRWLCTLLIIRGWEVTTLLFIQPARKARVSEGPAR